MGIFAAFYASELEPGQVILLPPARRGDVVQSLEVTHVEESAHHVCVHHDSGTYTCRRDELIQVQVER